MWLVQTVHNSLGTRFSAIITPDHVENLMCIDKVF
uniref:Uncharacterized protein n=1 Tax=Manihot esculenta TaxID=3983 RepID=A0A2C9W6T2_MANES